MKTTEMRIINKDNGDIEAIDGVGTVYSKINGRFYRITTDGKKTRIGEAVFEETLKDIEQGIEEELSKLVAETEESNNTEAGKEITKEMKKNKRNSKNTREVAGVALTEKQIDFIKHLPDTCFWEHGLDSCIWVDCLCDDIGGQFAGKPMTVGAMISTLCEKNLGTRAKDRMNGKKCTSFALTELGKVVAAELGLN